ncbi:MAG TPA: thioesterase family protein [Rubrivivax sp.]|nr:thioesterase family protein [Rubrivivax sp.]
MADMPHRPYMPHMPHPFDAAIALAPTGEHTFSGATQAAYANMVGPFGGTTCAVLLNAALRHPQRLGDPVALTVNYAAALADGAFTVDARAVRTNRSTQHWSLSLSQHGEVCATASAVFALRRPTWSATEAAPPQHMPDAASLPRAPLQGRPPWVRCYDMRFAEGGMPERFDAQEQAHSRSRLWVRDEPPRPLDFASLAAICDVFFPRIFIRRRRFTPIGTVSLSTYFHADAALLAAQGERHVLGCARGVAFRDGYFEQSAEVWGDRGVLLASSQQLVYFKD